jgi:hypothetical protein
MAGVDHHRANLSRADVSPHPEGRARIDEMVVAGGREQQRADDAAEVDALVTQVEIAAHQLVFLVQLLHELPERLARDRDVVVDPALHREEVGDEAGVVHGPRRRARLRYPRRCRCRRQ